MATSIVYDCFHIFTLLPPLSLLHTHAHIHTHTHTHLPQLEVAQAEVDIYRERFCSGERQLNEAKQNLQDMQATLLEKKRCVNNNNNFEKKNHEPQVQTAIELSADGTKCTYVSLWYIHLTNQKAVAIL